MKTAMQETSLVKKKESQERKILKYMQTGAGITPMHALNRFGCFRLSDRIFTLRRKGYDITTHRHKTGNGKIVGRYTLNTPF